jgi:hypothetical protein
MISEFEGAKTVHAFDRVATVIGDNYEQRTSLLNEWQE